MDFSDCARLSSDFHTIDGDWSMVPLTKRRSAGSPGLIDERLLMATPGARQRSHVMGNALLNQWAPGRGLMCRVARLRADFQLYFRHVRRTIPKRTMDGRASAGVDKGVL